jgi:glycosyltransferase involved in cell wall biosynthesis
LRHGFGQARQPKPFRTPHSAFRISVLRQLIAARGLDRIVELPGPKSQTEIVELLAQSQIFAFPARRDETGDQDNLPTVLIEAMASGLPIVTSRFAPGPEKARELWRFRFEYSTREV